MKLGIIFALLVCLSQNSDGAQGLEKIQKNWLRIQNNLPEPWKVLFEQASLKSAADNETELSLCTACQDIVPTLKLLAAIIPDFDAIRDSIYDLCVIIISSLDEGADAERTCYSVDVQGPPVISILKNRDATTDRICRNMNLCIDPAPEVTPRRVVPRRRQLRKTRSIAKKTKSKVNQRSAVIRFAQVADIHVDPKYAIGSPTDCGLVVCCREHYSGNGSAGEFGTYQCNTPQRTLELFLQKVKDLNPDFVVHTGDNPTHHLWEEKREESIECSNIAYDSLQRVMQGTPVYCAAGNHEAFPTNLYNPEDEMTQDLLKRFVGWWGPLADLGEVQQASILKGAVYSVATQIEGLRILSINSNYWYVYNFYNILLEGSEYELYVKTFVEESLAEARAAGDKVLILMHHPQGHSDNIVNHARWYRQVVAEYSDVILFGLSGHTHYDEVKLYRDPATGNANSVVHVAPSLTTMSSSGGINPSMRIFTLDAQTFEVLEIEQYQLDLSKIDNENPEIELVYKFTEEYALPDASVASMAEFIQRLGSDEAFFNKWWQNRNTRAPRNEDCLGECRSEQLCNLDSVVFDEYQQCVRNTRSKYNTQNIAQHNAKKQPQHAKEHPRFIKKQPKHAEEQIKTIKKTLQPVKGEVEKVRKQVHPIKKEVKINPKPVQPVKEEVKTIRKPVQPVKGEVKTIRKPVQLVKEEVKAVRKVPPVKEEVKTIKKQVHLTAAGTQSNKGQLHSIRDTKEKLPRIQPQNIKMPKAKSPRNNPHPIAAQYSEKLRQKLTEKLSRRR